MGVRRVRENARDISGIILLDKAKGESSNRSLQRVKRIFNARKAGHTGSLDPLATGVLPLCFGEATKISQFLLENFKHFNAASLVDAAKGYEAQLEQGNKMMITLAGAMSTAELGKTLAEMIRQDKVQIISCTGANLEEDIMNLVAHSHYKRVPEYRDLTAEQERELLDNGLNRVTDTCIPEEEAFRRLQKHIYDIWKKADESGKRYFPHECMYEMLLSGVLEQYYEIDPKHSWMLAAAEKNLPIVVPGWEDSTMGNIFASYCMKKELNAQ